MSHTVIGIGEALWDLLPGGSQLGGAPANFACHAQALGAKGRIITRVGNDALGREILRRFAEMGLPGDTVQVDESVPTGTVSVTLSNDGVPLFIIHENVAWDRLEKIPSAIEAVRGCHAVCFGTLAQRHTTSQTTIQQLLRAVHLDALGVLDINLRQHFYSREIIDQSLGLANVLKLNDSELPILAEMFGLHSFLKNDIERLAAIYNLKLVALTRGAQGSLLWQQGRWSEQPPRAVNVVDTVGAGDAFTAALVMGVLCGLDLDEVHAAAAEVASYVCAHAGATPLLPENFDTGFSSVLEVDNRRTEKAAG